MPEHCSTSSRASLTNPSIIRHILSFADKATLAKCIGVSSQFYRIAGPLVYEDLDITARNFFRCIITGYQRPEVVAWRLLKGRRNTMIGLAGQIKKLHLIVDAALPSPKRYSSISVPNLHVHLNYSDVTLERLADAFMVNWPEWIRPERVCFHVIGPVGSMESPVPLPRTLLGRYNVLDHVTMILDPEHLETWSFAVLCNNLGKINTLRIIFAKLPTTGALTTLCRLDAPQPFSYEWLREPKHISLFLDKMLAIMEDVSKLAAVVGKVELVMLDDLELYFEYEERPLNGLQIRELYEERMAASGLRPGFQVVFKNRNVYLQEGHDDLEVDELMPFRVLDAMLIEDRVLDEDSTECGYLLGDWTISAPGAETDIETGSESGSESEAESESEGGTG